MPELPEWRFIIAAYVVTWVVLVGYAFRLVRLRRRASELVSESLTGTEATRR